MKGFFVKVSKIIDKSGPKLATILSPILSFYAVKYRNSLDKAKYAPEILEKQYDAYSKLNAARKNGDLDVVYQQEEMIKRHNQVNEFLTDLDTGFINKTLAFFNKLI